MNRPRPNTPEAARRRVAWHHAGQQIDALREDQALNNTIGQGIGYGIAAAELAPEFVALRVAGGLRWAGATRAAVVATRLAEQASWAGTEGELIGGRTAWQEYKTAPWQESATEVFIRGGFDYTAQASANLLTGDSDPYHNVNILETGMSVFGLRPAIIGFGSAAVNLNSRGYLKTVFPLSGVDRVTPASFAAQALIGTTIGRGALALEGRFLQKASKGAALGLYMHVVLRQPRFAYPLGLGLYHLGLKGVPALIGVLEETSEGTADNYFTPAPTVPPDSLSSRPR